MIENIRSAGMLTLSDAVIFGQPGGVSFQQFQAENTVDGMGGLALEDGVHIVYPSGAVLLRTNGSMFGPPEEPMLLAEWRLKYAQAWHKEKVREFNDCKRQASLNPVGGYDWLPDLRRLRDVAKRAQENLKECHEAYEIACGRGPDWRRQQKQMAEQTERARQAEENRRAKALAAIHAITIDDENVARDDDE